MNINTLINNVGYTNNSNVTTNRPELSKADVKKESAEFKTQNTVNEKENVNGTFDTVVRLESVSSGDDQLERGSVIDVLV